MIVKVNVKSLAEELAKDQVHDFYRRLSFLLADENYDSDVVKSLYLQKTETGDFEMNTEAQELYEKFYNGMYNKILKYEMSNGKF